MKPKLLFFFFLVSLIFTNKTFAQAPTYLPIPTNTSRYCLLDNQRPVTPQKCVDCLLSFRTDLRGLYDSGGHNVCSNQLIINHFCNGGMGQQAVSDCNGLKFGVCSQPPDQPCLAPTTSSAIPGLPTLRPTPPATVNTASNPRGCGILYTNGIPSCWCNNGGGQGLCGSLPLEGIGGCRDLCEKGEFVGPKGKTHCFMMAGNEECRSNDDGSYRFCLKRCLPGSPGYSQKVGCEYPNKTVFDKAVLDIGCINALNNSSNFSFSKIFDSIIKGITNILDIRNFISTTVRVPGLQKAECNPAKENCSFE